MKKFWHYFQYLAAISAGSLISLLPRSWFFPVSRAIARLLYPIPQLGGVTLENLRVAFPEKTEKERRRIAIASLANLVLVLLEFFWIPRHKNFLEQHVEMLDDEKKELSSFPVDPENGLMLITPHHGNWEFAGQYLPFMFHCKVATIVRTPQNPYIGQFLTKHRAIDDVEIIESKGAARGMLKALKEGKALGLLIDQNCRVRDSGVFVNFFGLPVPVTAFPAHLARTRGLRVRIGGIYHDGQRLVMRKYCLPKEPSEYASDEELTQEFIKFIENIVREHPEQYLWMYRRFQYIPREADEALKQRYPSYAKTAPPSFYDQRERKSHNK